MRDPVTIGSATLYCGDCLSFLSAIDAVGAVVTDPPYGTDESGGGYGRSGRGIANDGDLSQIAQVAQIVRDRFPAIWVAAFYSPRKLREFVAAMAPLEHRGELVWDKKAPGMGGGLRYQHEAVGLYTSPGTAPPLAACFSMLPAYRTPEEHPHQKPVGLMSEILRVVPGSPVLDPFMGSGSTGVACAKLGRPFIGIELDADYFDLSCRRIEAAARTPELFAAPPREQLSLVGS